MRGLLARRLRPGGIGQLPGVGDDGAGTVGSAGVIPGLHVHLPSDYTRPRRAAATCVARHANPAGEPAMDATTRTVPKSAPHAVARRRATLYRMATPEHLCPFGLKSRDLLAREHFEVEDHLLTTREATDAFMHEQGVKTTPQTFIDGRRIGGWDELRRFFGQRVKDPDAASYQPVVAVFGMAALMAMAASWGALGELAPVRIAEWFAAISMCILAIQKLRDLERFSNMFLGYDLLARRVVRYAYVYPFAEALAGLLMAAHLLPWVSAPLALFIGTVGAVSVFKAVYLDKRELKCACVGGDSNVPLGFVSLSENLMMVAMGVWTVLS
jgi:glutaredoxin